MTALPLSRRLSLSLSTLLRPTQRRSTEARLASLDDRMLRDIGLTRTDVVAMRRMW